MSNPYFNREIADATLTQIHRQEEGSVLTVCTALRNGDGIQYGDFGDVQVKPSGHWMADLESNPDGWLSAGFVIVDTHKTRRQVNRILRRHRGFDGYDPRTGDRLMICRNSAQVGLSNGDVIVVTKVEWDITINGFVVHECVNQETEELINTPFAIPCNRLAATYETVGDRLSKAVLKAMGLPMVPVDFGYAVTCHAAQGSERDDVIIVGRWMNVAEEASERDLQGDSFKRVITGNTCHARLEAIADPGGIIVSKAVADYAKGKTDFFFHPLGSKRLKNINRPVEVYSARSEAPVPEKRRMPLLSAGLAVILALCAGLFFWLSPFESKPSGPPRIAVAICPNRETYPCLKFPVIVDVHFLLLNLPFWVYFFGLLGGLGVREVNKNR